MPGKQACGRCGTEVDDSTANGYCLRCLLQEGLSEDESEARNQTTEATGHKPEVSRRAFAGAGERFGNYELLEKVGQGGMGMVYKARQVNLDRIVAIKLLPFGHFSTEEVVQRFKSEAAAAAGLHHPNIVAIHDVGEEGGQHYFSMDFIEGRTLAELVQEKPLPAKRAAAYLKTIAEAVHYAHEHGILHRDLKPSNILIDGSDRPQITDFGLAKRLTVDSDMTLTGQVLGSPNFMAPEQAEGRLQAIGRVTEVYSLGALLYHLLTRQPPFQADTLTTLLKQVIETDPIPPGLLNPSIPRDLETICLKCLEKEARRRYQSARDLAEELARFLANEPVNARPVGALGKGWRWCRRQPVRAGLLAALITVFLAGSVGVLSQWHQARLSAQAEAQQRLLATKAAYAANIGLAQSLIDEGQFDRAREILLSTPEPHRGWEWGWLQRSCNEDWLTLSSSNVFQTFAAFSPDMRFLATGGLEPDIHVWELETGREVRTLRGHTTHVLNGAFSPDGRRFASAGWTDKTARIWDAATGEPLWKLNHPSGVKHVAFSPDGRQLVTTCMDGLVRLWDPATGQSTGESASYGDYVECAEFSPDGQYIAYSGGCVFWTDSLDTSVRIWEPATGRARRLEGHGEMVYALAWSPKGDLLASAGLDGEIKLWDPKSGREVASLESPGDHKSALSVAFSSDGRYLGVAGGRLLSTASWAEVFDVKTRRPVRELSGHSGIVMGIAFSRDGQWIGTAARDGTFKLWPVTPAPASPTLAGHDQVICAAAFSPNGHQVATGSFDQKARVWDADTGTLIRSIQVCFPVVSLAYSPDGSHLLTPGPDNTACIWQVDSGRQRLALQGHARAVMAVAWSPDNRWCAAGSKDRTARIWDARSGTERRTLTGHTGWVRALAFAPNSKLLATGSADSTVRLWEVESGRCLRRFTNHAGPILSLVFNPEGKWLASGSDDSTARIWDVETGREAVPPLTGHPRGVVGLAFSPDGQRLATTAPGENFHENVTRDVHVRLWDARSGHQLLSLTCHTNSIYAVAFSPDGRRLLTGGFDNLARIQLAFPWNSTDYPGDPRRPLATRIEEYKRRFWQSIPTNQLGPQSANSRHRLLSRWVGEVNAPPAGAKERPLLPIPPRPRLASSNQLDLAACYNVALNESWQGVGQLDQVDRNLATLPAGLYTFAGVPFDARGLVQLQRAAPDCELFPKTALVPVHRAIQRLHCLHGTREEVEQDQAVAGYLLHYADGTSAELPVIYGVHLREVVTPDSNDGETPQGQPAWMGPRPTDEDWQPRLYKTTYTNPKPDTEVIGIEFASKLTRSGPFLVALTVE